MHTLSRTAVALAVAVAAAALSSAPLAADVKMIAKVTSITVAADGKSAVTTLSNTKDGKAVTVTVADKATLDMIADKRIKVGDEVRLSYDDAGGANVSKTFKKSGGC
jgi:hypothetical protein